MMVSDRLFTIALPNTGSTSDLALKLFAFYPTTCGFGIQCFKENHQVHDLMLNLADEVHSGLEGWSVSEEGETSKYVRDESYYWLTS